MKKFKVVAVVAVIVTAATVGVSSSFAASPRYVTVVKSIGNGWFDRLNTGITEWAKATGTDATMTGATDASPEKQVKIVQDLIAQGVTGIGVVPNSPPSMEGVLKQARAAGIKVVTHEASNQINTDADIEAFDNTAYGKMMMDNLAACMHNSGDYVAFVGHVTAQSHMQWVAGALAEAKAKYPKIHRIQTPIESLENADVAYQKAKTLLKKYPHLKGFEGSGATDVVGIGRAIDELGLANKTCVMGTSIPSLTKKYLATGAIDKIFFWDPAVAGKAINVLLTQLVAGKPITNGEDLGLPGYHSIQRSKTSKTTWTGNGWVIVNKSNAAKYPF